ncbi:hypothetical protein [Petroclostridium sp. X23]|uniref:prenylated flavin chaperone LpdD n=1 Tax=Petroclostridium sp. X23 TaxID=3045146 RepID=UPI0024AE39F7|nr:hypothetical protein [Petroclostridium sp. X23]WHH60811.1 hypothetical protein QKW49_08970 [Petroclostridium sp. X23]
MIQIIKTKGRLQINMTAFPMGNDVCIILTGGDTPHLGALTAGSYCESLQTITFYHHKENVITEMFGNILRRAYKGNLAVCCGIHLDNITSQEIVNTVDLCREIAEKLSELLREDDQTMR